MDKVSEPPISLLRLWASNVMYKGTDEGLLAAKQVAAERLVFIFGSIQEAALALKAKNIL